MPSIRSCWMVALGLALATPVLAGTTPVRRETQRRPVHQTNPLTTTPVSPSLEGGWARGGGPRDVGAGPMNGTPFQVVSQPQVIRIGVGGAVALLDVAEPAALPTRAPAGLAWMLEIEQPAPGTAQHPLSVSKPMFLLEGVAPVATRRP